MISVILDTNILLSAFLFNGMTRIFIDLIFEDTLQLYISLDLEKEVLRKLYEYKADIQIINRVTTLLDYATSIKPNITITASRDPEDNFLLELAQTCNAGYLITRDNDLLSLPNQKWKNTIIMKPEEFLPLLRKMKLL